MCLLMTILGLLLLFCLGLFYLITFAFDFSFLNWFNFCFWLFLFFVDFIFCWFYFQMIFLTNDFFIRWFIFRWILYFAVCIQFYRHQWLCTQIRKNIYEYNTKEMSKFIYVLICEPKLRKRNTNQENQHRKRTLWRSHKAI